MSYQPQSQEEQAYIAELNAHDKAIWDYHQQRGVPLEDAFQAVTGKPWMAGRSIKFVGGTGGNTGNGFDMTKDRTFKSVLGKYIAPIGAGALTALTLGGAAPSFAALFGGGGGAAAGGGGAAAGAGAGGAAAAGGGVAAGLAAPSIGRELLRFGLPAGISAATNIIGARSAAGAADKAAELEAEAARQSLAFLKDQEAARQREFQSTQDRNYGLYQDQQARLEPYRRAGAGSIGQLMQPIPRGNSIGSLMGGR